MGNMIIGVTFMMILNLLMFFANHASAEIANSDNVNATVLYKCSNSVMSAYSSDPTCTNITVNKDSFQQDLSFMSSTGEYQTGTSAAFSFTDIIRAAKSFVIGVPKVLTTFVEFLAAPWFFLTSLNLSPVFAGGIAVAWYAITFLLIMGWFLGRDT